MRSRGHAPLSPAHRRSLPWTGTGWCGGSAHGPRLSYIDVTTYVTTTSCSPVIGAMRHRLRVTRVRREAPGVTTLGHQPGAAAWKGCAPSRGSSSAGGSSPTTAGGNPTPSRCRRRHPARTCASPSRPLETTPGRCSASGPGYGSPPKTPTARSPPPGAPGRGAAAGRRDRHHPAARPPGRPHRYTRERRPDVPGQPWTRGGVKAELERYGQSRQPWQHHVGRSFANDP